jgi:hypothetical protein
VKHAQSVAGEGAIAAAVLSRDLAHAAFEEGIGNTAWTPFKPFTTWLTRKSAAMLATQ